MQGRAFLKRTAVILAAVLGLAVSASAATLISNTGQALGGSGGGSNFLDINYRYATDFTTNGLISTVTGATGQVANFDNIAHTFTISIYTDNSGTPQGGTLVGTFNAFTVAANTSFPGTPSSTVTPISSFNLAANTTYWEVLQMDETFGTGSAPQAVYTSNETTDTGSLYNLISATALKTSTNGGSTYSDVTFFSSPVHGNYYFSLTGTQAAPEPSRALLSLAGLGALMLRRKRK